MAEMDRRASDSWRDEHATLRREAAQLARTASMVSNWSVPESRRHLEEVQTYLHDDLLPHATAEESIIYPMVEALLGTGQFTAAMRHDHAAIRDRVEAVTNLIGTLSDDPPTPAQAEALREHLYGLWAIIELHLDKEEEIIFDLLDTRLSPSRAQEGREASARATRHPSGGRPLVHTEMA